MISWLMASLARSSAQMNPPDCDRRRAAASHEYRASCTFSGDLGQSLSRRGGMSFVTGREEVEHESRAEEIPAHVHGVARGDVGRGGGDRVAFLDHRGEVIDDPEAEP